jgi:hypothetical protein
MSSISAVVGVALVSTGLLAADDRPKHNTISDKEKAAGWILLFDGKETKGWKVEGEAKVVDGVLVVGGNKPAKIRTADTFGNLELRFEFRTKGKENDIFVTMVRVRLLGSVKDKKDVWNELNLTAEGKTIRSEDKAPGGDYQNLKITLSEERGNAPVDFEVPTGAKLFLRNVKLKKR